MKKVYYITSMKTDLTSEYIIIYKNKIATKYFGCNLSTNRLKQIIKRDYNLKDFSLIKMKTDYTILKGRGIHE